MKNTHPALDLKSFVEKSDLLCDNIRRMVVAREDTVRLTVVGLFSGGHVLLEDVPGVGKTLLAKALVGSLRGASFRRIQFTADMLPTDITGGAVYNQKESVFTFSPGPVFANIVLADEINRATPRTQSALLEAMGEGQVSIENVTYPLEKPFFVVATQNPVETHGTFPLPEAQLDRFLLSLSIGYPDREGEMEILTRSEHEGPDIYPVLDMEDVLVMVRAVREVDVSVPLKEYVIALVSETREDPNVVLGVSPRGAVALQRVAQGLAAMSGRSYVLPDDVKSAALPVLCHRLIMRSAQGPSPYELVNGLLEKVKVRLY